MESKGSLKSVVIEIICYLYILLFVYAAVSKLLDFENFQVQLGQSPLLSAFAVWVAWLVPLIELVIAAALIIPKFRNVGLFGTLALMTMFSFYIYIILHYSSFIPCSCGGILEKMTWNIHLVFNIVFVLLSVMAIILNRQKAKTSNRCYNTAKQIAGTTLISISVVVILFLSSENIMHRKNPFIRRYPQHPITLDKTIDLKFNSFYFAGNENNRIFLGNYTNPLQVVSWDSGLKNKRISKITFNPKKIPFKMVKIAVRGQYFYLNDGHVPAVFIGNIKDWKINSELKGSPRFSLVEPIDSTTIIFRSNHGKNAAHVLGRFSTQQSPKIKYNSNLLQKQVDGIFDTDGIMLYDEKLGKIIYLYYYRNQYIVVNNRLLLDYRGNTIDTITKAKIKVAYLTDKNQRTMSAPPLVVNAHAATYGNLLFVHSKVKGRFENDKLWEQASIIDVYDINKKSYLLSFALYERPDKKLQSFIVTATHLYAIVGNDLMSYKLTARIKNEMKTVQGKFPDS
ncbi:MauE/DoxX family redox-associated membrane protein [Flavobacterium flavigenum]|uniref:MauE/DoxX family redox-associated membrane protein n=1 Tax=Flavobacterium flavigenum TaxID=3003258 RepID=UPI0022ABF92A|nr:MauE/DoxX family redox-associated membrane protein [Flavobacterium flavigenum]